MTKIVTKNELVNREKSRKKVNIALSMYDGKPIEVWGSEYTEEILREIRNAGWSVGIAKKEPHPHDSPSTMPTYIIS